MPNQLLKSIHEEYGIPMDKLEDYWNRAKELAASRGKEAENYWAYVNAIFQNMLKLQSDSAEYPTWWKKLDKDDQAEYLKDHPHSKLKPGSDDSNEHTIQSDSDEHVQKDSGMSAKLFVTGAYKRSQEAIHATLTKNKNEVAAVGKFLTGGALNKEEQGHAIDFAKKAGALLVGAIVVASLATPLAGYGAELGKYFFDNFSFQPSDKEPVSEYMSQFTDWFAEQDQNTLLKKVKGD